jgi:hypothetical protein
MSDLEKGRVYQHKMYPQKLVKITKMADGDRELPTIVIFREVEPDFRFIPNSNIDILGFEFKSNLKEVYLEKEEFQQLYQWFAVDEETMGKIRAGWSG